MKEITITQKVFQENIVDEAPKSVSSLLFEILACRENANALILAYCKNVLVARDNGCGLSSNRTFKDHVVLRVAADIFQTAPDSDLDGPGQITPTGRLDIPFIPAKFRRQDFGYLQENGVADRNLVIDKSAIQRGQRSPTEMQG